MNRRGDLWNESIKPVIMVVMSILTWVVSMVFFVVGFSFGSEMIFGKYNVGFLVAVVVGLILTAIELTWNEEKEDLLDWAIWLFAYALGITSNFYGLMLLLGMADPNVEKIIAGSLGALIEIAPERMLIRGLSKMNIRFDPSGIVNAIFGGKKKQKSNPQMNNTYKPNSGVTYRTEAPKKPSNKPGQFNFPGPDEFMGDR